MHGTLSLNGVWHLSHNDDFPRHLTAETLPGRWALPAAVPAPIHQVLMDAGLLDDPRVGLNSLRARWVEEYYWAYRRTFTLPENYVEGTHAWLVFDRLEMCAVVYLNGQEVGRHTNAHRPARFEVTKFLRTEGENTVVVLIDAGLFDVSEKPGAEYRDTPQARLTKIHWHRRGQWQRGWDWQQRLLNVGILGAVRLEWSDHPIVEQLKVFATVSDDLQRAVITTWVTLLNPTDENATVRLSIRLPEESEHRLVEGVTVSVTAEPGMSAHELTLPVNTPRLWWPIGQGEQPLYRAEVILAAGEETTICERRVGIRRVEVNQSPHPVEGKYFTLKINNRPIFCKGGNWVPADMLYSTVTGERYRELVDLAIEANFNMLRIWGGGIYADPAFLDYCDEKGVLVWHDLLFACSKYPGDYPEFVQEVRYEVTWALREMAHHPSLVVWCGNNEIEEGDWHWGYDNAYRTHPHYALFHHDLPQIAAEEAPHCFYWISSPYSPDYRSPRDPTVGDQHPWKVSLQMHGGADWWEYRRFVDRFPNEGGVLGCSTPATLREFLPEKERRLLSASWEHHDNPFAINDITPGKLGHAYQTITLWTGRHPLQMKMEEYAFLSGLLQAEGISEYIANYRRRMFSSSSAIFWMYNDSWPTTHSWTIVDYYRRKRLPFHPVRRAFAPVTVFVAHEDDGFNIYGVNDTPEPWEGVVRFGYFSPWMEVKAVRDVQEFAVTLPANASVGLGATESFGKRRGYAAGFACLFDSNGKLVAQARQFLHRFHELGMIKQPTITMNVEDGVLTLKSDHFCWGVCLDENGDLPVPDNCFDLLPGIPYTLPWDSATLGEPRIARIGNDSVK